MGEAPRARALSPRRTTRAQPTVPTCFRGAAARSHRAQASRPCSGSSAARAANGAAARALGVG
eukprot:scaffold288412_cov32-Tisochrysis_lutea.AAC.1